MGPFYGYKPPKPEKQHDRIVAPRQLISRGIPCILWGEDAMNYVYSVPTGLFDQQILVPDDLLESAAAVLKEGRYVPAPPAWDYAEIFGPRLGESPFPGSIRLQHLDIPDDEPFKLDPLPGYILLLPQSYFGLDVRSTERFQSLVPPLDPSNVAILVPKYHTFLEGLVAFNMKPPTGLENPLWMGRMKIGIFIECLIQYRCKYDLSRPTPTGLLRIERQILSELQTDEARWYLSTELGERR